MGIDRGARDLLRVGLPLHLAVGDFDSVTAEERQAIHEAAQECIILPSEKNDTDTEAALMEMMKKWPQSEHIIFYGMLGGRLDHTLNNLWMVYQDRFQPVISRLEFISDTNTVRFLEPGDHTVCPYEGMTYLSLISMG
ncbi:thiamine diphosphokinase, partial [Corynebacterium pyruviciproducens]